MSEHLATLSPESVNPYLAEQVQGPVKVSVADNSLNIEAAGAPTLSASDEKQATAQLKSLFTRVQQATNTTFSANGKKNNIARGTKNKFKEAEKSMKNDAVFAPLAKDAIKTLHNVRPDLVKQACQDDEYEKLVQPMVGMAKQKKLGLLLGFRRNGQKPAPKAYQGIQTVNGYAATKINGLAAPKPEVVKNEDETLEVVGKARPDQKVEAKQEAVAAGAEEKPARNNRTMRKTYAARMALTLNM